MYQALYRTYRPEVFEEILGQEHIVKILKNQIKVNRHKQIKLVTTPIYSAARAEQERRPQHEYLPRV